MKNKLLAQWIVLGVFVWAKHSAASNEVSKLHCFLDGVRDDRHRGFSRFSMAREIDFIQKDQEVLNLRQVTIVSQEENNRIAQELGVWSVSASDLWANVLISGWEDFSKLPVWAIVRFSRGAFLMLTWDNFPCIVAGTQVQTATPEIAWIDKGFVKASIHRRGQTAIVYKTWVIKAWDTYEIIIPRHVQVGLDYICNE
jgi:hypothetical protein